MTEFGKELSGATSFIEKLSSAQYFFFVTNLFFLLDSCLVVFYEKNMLDLDFVIQSNISQRPVSIIVIFVISFLFINNFLFKMLRFFIQRYIISSFYTLIYIPYIKRDFNLDREYRNIRAVELEAIRNQDKFTLEQVEKTKRSYFEANIFDDEIFTFVCLLSINIWFVGSYENSTISQSLINFLEEDSSFIVGRILYPAFYAIVCILIWIAIQGFIPNEEYMYSPRTENKP